MIERFESFKKIYILFILTICYIVGELGHYLIGVTSRATARDIDYGDHACQLNNTKFEKNSLPIQCDDISEPESCSGLNISGVQYCEWDYNGLGLEYQLLAGPVFILVFTIVGVILGIAADKYNRSKMLFVCTLVFGVAIVLQGSVQNYWQLIFLRMIMAAGESGCNPLATGIMSDIFPENKRALVMAIFNWGVYGGYGIAFPVGRYLTKLNLWNLSWRVCYYATGVLALIIAVLMGLTLKEPERKTTNTATTHKHSEKTSLWKVLMEPGVIMLTIAASIRHCGGMTFAYNADLYYNSYFPNVDLGWWLFAVTIGIGSIGVVVGGIVSDKIVKKMGVRSRVLVLALSQLIASPGAFGSVYFDPFWAMITLATSYFFAEMWFGIVFAVIVEIVPLEFRSSVVGIFMFVINNVGGNLPILVDPLAKMIGYRESIAIFYAGFYLISSVLFFITMYFLEGKPKAVVPATTQTEDNINRVQNGVDNRSYIPDTVTMQQLSGRTTDKNYY
ncbi:CLUMA_CG015071, isoform A [Clunio marinus]|uniref:CLUMA_CG015071, isoform A n=1 Tax=Clunio marinus TaxID=568069 RepID=A0A1J1INU2_9DIPT|nr:CLUMA_CG015071, isoform A [Clunio marinus]